MSTPNRPALFAKIHKVLKRTYKYTPTKGDRPLMESLLFACCLENAPRDVAEASLNKLTSAFFDWNEIRVSTVKELAEILSDLPESTAAAARLKGVLQSVFESDYSFELEHLKKQNIGVAVKRLQKLAGATPFNVAYATQSSLGGHSIPVDKGTLDVLYILGVISEAEQKSASVPGMERAIPKTKGQEFGALLHELGAAFHANPFSPAVRDLLLSIAPDAKDRFPKRTPKKVAPEPAPVAAADGKKHDKPEAAAGKKGPAKEPVKEAAKGTAKRPSIAPAKPAASKPAPAKPAAAKSAPPKAASPAKKKAAPAKKPAAKALARRRPR